MEVTKLGIDLAKSSFHIAAKDAQNRIVFSKKLTSKTLRMVCGESSRFEPLANPFGPRVLPMS